MTDAASAKKEHRPELVFGLVGPIGCDIHRVEEALARALKQVDYSCHHINVSQSIADLMAEIEPKADVPKTLKEKISAGNKVREHYKNHAALAAHALLQIRQARKCEHEKRGTEQTDELDFDDLTAGSTAYIVRQLKRPEEIELLSRVYGRQFIKVSITQDKRQRISNLVQRVGRENHGLNQKQKEDEARNLVEIDSDEDDHFGQRISKIFHLADVFIDAKNEETISGTCVRFVDALFGKTNIAPTRDEFGSYIAKSASLRSVDLSRQVGAAIINAEGDIISIGCNEVPKAGGGNFWDEDREKYRDIDLGGEANKDETNRIVFSFLKVLRELNLLSSGSEPKKIIENTDSRNKIFDSMIGEITEYGRMVHAEMSAITDAARLGRAVKGATLYVTTFPCHNCAKHVIASGISRVVYIEPYPKSRAEALYGNAISVENRSDKTVSFEHFAGISPRRFRDIFEKGRRRSKSGDIHEWYEDSCAPRVGDIEIDVPKNETFAIIDNFPESAAQP